MSAYLKLAADLAAVSEAIRNAAGELQGEAAASAARKLEKAALAFQKIVAQALAASDPSVKELECVLASQPAREHLDAKALGVIGKAYLEGAFKPKKSETAAAARERFAKVAIGAGAAEEALKGITTFLSSLSLSLPDENDEEQLRNELRQFGALSRADKEIALETRLKGPLLVSLCRMTGFKPNAKGVLPKKKMEEFVLYCTNLHENTGWRAG